MFQQIGRRLALLNAAVVIAILALVGIVTYFTLRQALDTEVDESLYSRLEMISRSALEREVDLRERLEHEADEDDDDDEDEDDEWDDDDYRAIEALTSGDTIIFIVSPDRRVVYNPRAVEIPGLPVQEAIDRALAGHQDRRSITTVETGLMRVVTVPIIDDETIIGAAQGLQSLQQHEDELALVRWITLFGIGIGMLTAIPAGLYLSHRAMRPINQSFERQRSFVADASHELRTPLTLIRASAEYAMQDPDAAVATIEPELDSILDEVDRTDRLVDDLLILARADEGRLDLLRERLGLYDLLNRAIDKARPLANTHDLQSNLQAIGHEQVLADEDRIFLVVRILVDNAVKYTPPGTRILIEAHVASGEALVTVQDTGPGVPAEDIERVFNRFYRVDQSRSRSTGGSGLGLPIARALIEAHGGRIWLDRSTATGTSVIFSLPLASE